jgi:calcium-dependent protein kinase
MQIKCKLKQAIMTFILTQIEKGDEMKELLKIFRDLDTDHDGTLNKEELIIGLQRVKPKEDPKKIAAEVVTILAYIDSNLSGRIDFTEFAIATLEREKLLSADNLLNCFKMFDKVRQI